MARFLRRWLVPILALLMLVGIAVSFVPLTRRAEARAEEELTLLMERAFSRIAAGSHAADPVLAAQEQNLLDKAYAVRRFLEHDDTLLASDALKALCEQLGIDRIDVGDLEGQLIASSDETRIGQPLEAEDGYDLAAAMKSDPQATFTGAKTNDPSKLFACVGRSDIDGFVLLTRDDPYAAAALEKSDARELVSDLPGGKDILFVAASAGESGFFRESGNLCLRQSKEGFTLIAARPLSDVYAACNAALIAFGVALTCVAICGVAIYLLWLDPVTMVEEDDSRQEMEADAAQPAAEEIESAVKDPRGWFAARPRNQPGEIEARVDWPDENETTEEHARTVRSAPRRTGRGNRGAPPPAGVPSGTKPEQKPGGEDPFEKIVE